MHRLVECRAGNARLERRGGGEMVHRAGVADGMFAPGVSHESGDVKARGDVIGLGIGC